MTTLLAPETAIFAHLVGGPHDNPFILPSSSDPRSSLTVWSASSSHLTLFVMLVVTLIFMPLILLYTAWVYKVLWGKVTVVDIERDGQSLY
ncbi:MAG: cytochrome d ubiquinol oxidase subunit II [Paracoccaceae bacterium]